MIRVASWEGVFLHDDPSQFPAQNGSSHRTIVEKPRILVIDDDPVFRSVLQKLGPALGVYVEAYSSMMDLDPFAKLHQYDGAIIDYFLGSHDGLDVVAHWRSVFADIPTMIVSADPTVATRCKSPLASGVSEFLPKASGAVKILEGMKRLISRQHSLG